jgi:hypothetical protein
MITLRQSGLRKVKEGVTTSKKSSGRPSGDAPTPRHARPSRDEALIRMTLPELLKKTVDLDGSDLHLATNSPPQVRVHGKLQRLELAGPLAGRHQAARLQRADRRAEEAVRGGARARLLVRHPGLARFRCNLFNQRGAVARCTG